MRKWFIGRGEYEARVAWLTQRCIEIENEFRAYVSNTEKELEGFRIRLSNEEQKQTQDVTVRPDTDWLTRRREFEARFAVKGEDANAK